MLPAGAAKKETAKATFPSIAMTITKAIGGGGQVHTRVMTDFRYDIFNLEALIRRNFYT